MSHAHLLYCINISIEGRSRYKPPGVVVVVVVVMVVVVSMMVVVVSMMVVVVAMVVVAMVVVMVVVVSIMVVVVVVVVVVVAVAVVIVEVDVPFSAYFPSSPDVKVQIAFFLFLQLFKTNHGLVSTAFGKLCTIYITSKVTSELAYLSSNTTEGSAILV